MSESNRRSPPRPAPRSAPSQTQPPQAPSLRPTAPSVTDGLAAPPLGRPDTTQPFTPSGAPKASSDRLATVPLRPLIDIAQPRLTLIVQSEAGRPSNRTIAHEGDVCRIGTHPSNDVAVDDPAVSRFHCRIVPDPNGWRVEDLGSLNGTLLSDLRVLGAILPPEATLKIGESVIVIRTNTGGTKELVPMMPNFGGLTGTGRTMRKLFAVLEKVAASDINCLIHGGSGTGKELVATEIVQRGVRADRPFVVVDCGAISPTLVESELFGHVRGAFTGADRDRLGAFEAADGGTVFLDEVGELPLPVQPKLLRALEQREVRRVGETKTRKVNVRVISATNRDLEREVNSGTFREDLYFRLAVITVRVPSLRERIEDLPYLIRAFLTQLGAEGSEHLFGPEVMEQLARNEWPGNVRELRNYVERSVVLQSTRLSEAPPPMSVVTGARPPEVDVSVPYKVAKESLVDGFERAYVRAVLEASGGNLTKAAKIAGIDRMYLHRLVQKHATRDQLAGGVPPPSSTGFPRRNDE